MISYTVDAQPVLHSPRQSSLSFHTKMPHTLTEICINAISRHLDRYTDINLPHELTLRILQVLLKAKNLNTRTLLPFLNPQLRTLDLSGCQDIDFGRLATLCTNLETLILQGCLVINDSHIVEVAKGCPNLKALNLSFNKKISDTGIKRISTVCSDLQVLNLSWCSKITDRSLLRLAENCRQLETLNCSNCRLLTGKGIEELGTNCTMLKSLNLKGCRKLEDITLKSKSLEWLHLGHCEKLTADSIPRLRCPNLKTLYLTSCKQITDEAILQVTNNSIWQVARDFGKLQELDLSFCNISTATIVSSRLTTLHLNDCTQLREEIFEQIAIGCPLLEAIHLRGCSSLNDDCIARLADGCSKLRTLNLSRCDKLTDDSVKHIARNCALLEEIHLSWCSKLTDLSLEYLWKGCFFIEAVKIFGCTKITRNAVYTMKQNLPRAAVDCVQSDREWCMFETL